MEETRTLAAFCADLSYEKLPAPVVEKAKLCVLDFLANVYGSFELEAFSALVPLFRERRGPEIATAIGCGFKTGLRDAALLNGTAAEAIEAQDGLRFGGNHPGTAVIPAALAVAEETSAGGRAFLEAVVAGYEAANRIAASVHPRHTLSGFLPTGTCGTFGAACAAARLMGLNATGTLGALGNAGYLAPLSMAEQLMGGHPIKIVQGGQAAACGILAAFLSRAGIQGSPDVLEGSALKGGFLQITTGGQAAPERLTDRLGQHYSLLDVYLKPYTSCRHTHGAAQAVLTLVEAEDLGPEDIERIDVYTYGIGALAVGKGVSREDTFVSAQFSIPYVVACCVADREMGPGQLRRGRLLDPALLDFCRKVSVRYDEELNKLYPDKTATRVEIHLKDGGTRIRQVDTPRGDPRDPMTPEEVADKLKRFARGRNPERLQEIVRLVSRLDEVGDIRRLTVLL